ncbi:uncharacterized protein LOC128200692 [Galleria mellonella]|uniref:Uncharacterized protein LOC128200692 n=1 Tax=Galleria mellonella TaxID=7137 RepID=A0ABM3MHL3_GALME|nr:uncharacterized protein LOC128200692 [Galleria mellonella]
MQKNTAVLTVVCILLCLAFNYTFSLRRDTNKKWSFIRSNRNRTRLCNALHHTDIAERTKKMVNNMENAMKKIKDSAHDIYINGIKKSQNKIKFSDDDFRSFELSVIMKKYPYLDLKEIEQKFSPSSNKNTRQSYLALPDEAKFRHDPSLCESGDDIINVEISNRGLSGFSIPPKLIKSESMFENKLKVNNLKNPVNMSENLIDVSKVPDRDVLNSLKADIISYEETKIHKDILIK